MIKYFVFLLFLCPRISTCPKGSIPWQSQCYFFKPNLTAFLNAENECIQLGGHLASIHDGFTNAFIAQQGGLLLQSSKITEIWIGATDLILSGNFSWTDNTNFTFTEWGQMKNVSGEDCVSMNLSTGQWIAQDCFKLKAYLCATSSTPSTPAPPAFYNCSIGWVYFEPTSACYGFLFPLLDFNSVIKYCEDNNLATISVHTKIENEFLRTMQLMGGNRAYWLSLFSVDETEKWEWADHTPVDFLNWGSGYPIPNGYPCAYVDTDGLWYNVEPCVNDYQTICKRHVDNFYLN